METWMKMVNPIFFLFVSCFSHWLLYKSCFCHKHQYVSFFFLFFFLPVMWAFWFLLKVVSIYFASIKMSKSSWKFYGWFHSFIQLFSHNVCIWHMVKSMDKWPTRTAKVTVSWMYGDVCNFLALQIPRKTWSLTLSIMLWALASVSLTPLISMDLTHTKEILLAKVS